MKIKSIKEIGKERTLDLEVNHPLHQFYCNGFLTSNSHSISYTFTSFREYWLKAHHDPEFNVTLLNNTDKGKESKGESVIAQYITEMLKKGYKINHPDINKSESLFTLDSENDHNIIWGLGWVKNLPDATIERIVEERKNGPFESIEDLFSRLEKKFLNKRAIEALVWSGALDQFGERIDTHKEIYEELRKDKKYEMPKMTERKLIEKEVEFCSISLKEIELFASMKKEVEVVTGRDVSPLFEAEAEGEYFVVGKVSNLENRKTKTKKDYVRISLIDESKMSKSIFVWPWKCRGWDELKNGQMIAGTIQNDGNFKNLTGYSFL